MAASTGQPASHRHIRPLWFLAAALVIVVAGVGIDRLGVMHPAATRPAAGLPAGVAPLGGTVTAPGAAAPAIVPVVPVVPVDGPAVDLSASTASLDKAIGVWTANLQRDAEDFVSAQNLALDYYTRGRLTGSIDDYSRAQAAVEQGLRAYPADTAGQTMRALLAYTLHDFQGALAEAQAIYGADHTVLQALATVGDSQLELGDYGAAAATFEALEKAQPGAAVTARLAHLAALQGRDAEAATLAARAGTEARAEGTDGTALAFYDYLRGFIAFQAGDLEAARAGYQAALVDWPGSYTALEGLAKVSAAQGRTVEAIALYRQAIAIVPQPQYLAGLGDLYQLTGQNALADQQYATVRAIAQLQATQPTVYDRQLVLFDANHGQDPAGAVALAERELAVRKDVYGWDAYAWALLGAGRATDADAAMTDALGQGTHDALLSYHAGMIAHAVGDDVRARTQLTAALGLNPGFDPLQAARARQVLAGLP